MSYYEQLEKSLEFSKKIGIQNLQWDCTVVRNLEELQSIFHIITTDVLGFIDSFRTVNPYLGNQCLLLAANTFMILKARGFDVEMIYGNVNVNDSPDDEWDTTYQYLEDEYRNKVREGIQDIHAWVGFGSNFIIDFALPERLWKNYKYPKDVYHPCAEIDFLEDMLKVKYKPMLVGTDFFKETNNFDPLEHFKNFI